MQLQLDWLYGEANHEAVAIGKEIAKKLAKNTRKTNTLLALSLPLDRYYMQHFSAPVMWAQIDGNMHMRHSAYADFATQARMFELAKAGITTDDFQLYKLGPILFREETIYLKEVKVGDTITVKIAITESRPDASRWTIRHELFRSDGIKCAQVIIDGAWMGFETRKLITPPAEFTAKFMQLPTEGLNGQ